MDLESDCYVLFCENKLNRYPSAHLYGAGFGLYFPYEYELENSIEIELLCIIL